jgi:hypothetical protein
MPVTILEQGPRRLPLLGTIHLGDRQRTTSRRTGQEVEYPVKVDYFLVREDNHTRPEMVEAFRSVYGEKPRQLDVLFPSDDESVIMPVSFSAYRASGLWCRGPGEHPDGTPGIATRVYDPEDPTLAGISLPEGVRPGSMIQVPLCHHETCPYHANGKDCKLLARLHVMLPDVPGLGVWRITTSSWNSVKNLLGGIAFVKLFTGGRVAGIPLKLRLVPQQVQHEGRKSVVYVLSLANEQVRLRSLIEAARQPLEDRFLLPEADEREIPEDHFPAAAAAAEAKLLPEPVEAMPPAEAPEPAAAAGGATQPEPAPAAAGGATQPEPAPAAPQAQPLQVRRGRRRYPTVGSTQDPQAPAPAVAEEPLF